MKRSGGIQRSAEQRTRVDVTATAHTRVSPGHDDERARAEPDAPSEEEEQLLHFHRVNVQEACAATQSSVRGPTVDLRDAA
ncbi:hypothetical protein F2P81_009214 [Scophthalmus maximus]|uniref:Uncharacterized protein n=1 Tax=Scophthalmus maximus TaxID=52904 RepID=A0A6A4T3X8_SCOMX|nr:hypothetical protein F2P81_009214 [Scophthalmus maximus]